MEMHEAILSNILWIEKHGFIYLLNLNGKQKVCMPNL